VDTAQIFTQLTKIGIYVSLWILAYFSVLSPPFVSKLLAIYCARYSYCVFEAWSLSAHFLRAFLFD